VQHNLYTVNLYETKAFRLQKRYLVQIFHTDLG